MLSVSDLIRDSRLETSFPASSTSSASSGEGPRWTSHVFTETGRSPRQRVIRRREVWQRERFIGGGAYGSIWLERCVKTGRQKGSEGDQDGHPAVRAVKQIRRPAKRHGDVEYGRELEATAKFSHQKYNRCFVRSFGWFEWQNALLISMEYLPDGDMDEYLYRSPPLPEPEVQQVTFQLLEGLEFMHRNGFIHRDLKPKNILIKSKPPDPWWVKIGDFGISRRAEAEFSASTALKGTLGFIAPEVHGLLDSNDSNRHFLGASDMWALGETVFRFLTKRPCFDSMKEMISYAQHQIPLPLDPLREKSVSDHGIAFIQSLVVASPDERLKAGQALEHPWIDACHDSKDDSNPPSIIDEFEGEQSYQELGSDSRPDASLEASGQWTVQSQVTDSNRPSLEGQSDTLTDSDSTDQPVENNASASHDHQDLPLPEADPKMNDSIEVEGDDQSDTQEHKSDEKLNGDLRRIEEPATKIFGRPLPNEPAPKKKLGFNQTKFRVESNIPALSTQARTGGPDLGTYRRVRRSRTPKRSSQEVMVSATEKIGVEVIGWSPEPGQPVRPYRLWEDSSSRVRVLAASCPMPKEGMVRISPDGTLTAASGKSFTSVQDVRGKKNININPSHAVARESTWTNEDLSFSADGKTLAGITASGFWAWNAETGRLICRETGRYHDVMKAVAVGLAGEIMATASTDKGRLWDVRTGALLETIHKSRDAKNLGGNTFLSDLEFAPTESLLAVTGGAISPLRGNKMTLTVLDALTWREKNNYVRKSGSSVPRTPVFSPQSPNMLAVICSNFTKYEALIFDLRANAVGQHLNGVGVATEGACTFSPDGQTLAIGEGRSVKLFDVRRMTMPRCMLSNIHDSAVNSIIFSPGGGRTASTATRDPFVVLSDIKTPDTIGLAM